MGKARAKDNKYKISSKGEFDREQVSSLSEMEISADFTSAQLLLMLKALRAECPPQMEVTIENACMSRSRKADRVGAIYQYLQVWRERNQLVSPVTTPEQQIMKVTSPQRKVNQHKVVLYTASGEHAWENQTLYEKLRMMRDIFVRNGSENTRVVLASPSGLSHWDHYFFGDVMRDCQVHYLASNHGGDMLSNLFKLVHYMSMMDESCSLVCITDALCRNRVERVLTLFYDFMDVFSEYEVIGVEEPSFLQSQISKFEQESLNRTEMETHQFLRIQAEREVTLEKEIPVLDIVVRYDIAALNFIQSRCVKYMQGGIYSGVTVDTFVKIVSDLAAQSTEDCLRLFNGCKRQRNAEYLVFEDIVLLLNLMDPHTQQMGEYFEERVRFLFRVYDVYMEGYLDIAAIRSILLDVERKKPLGVDMGLLEEKIKQKMIKKGFTIGTTVTYDAFEKMIRRGEIAGTSTLFRMQTSLSGISKHSVPYMTPPRSPMGRVRSRSCPSPSAYLLNRHTSYYDGHVEPSPMRGRSRSSLQPFPPEAFKEFCEVPVTMLSFTDDSKGLKVAERVLEYLLHKEWDEPETTVFRSFSVEDMTTLCNATINTLKEENTLVHVEAPVKVFGDIHGQFPELRLLFDTYGSPQHRTGDIRSFQYLFLGDFVDRGDYSIEVVLLLFALKVRYPHNVVLVRGNHEDREYNVAYGFKKECEDRILPTRRGIQMWNTFNNVFDWMPLGAVINRKILCVHGGIGTSLQTLDQLAEIPRPLDLTLDDDGEMIHVPSIYQDMILDVLWSDPTESDHVLGSHASLRGDGLVVFGPDIVDRYLAENDLQCIIRAHECVQAGFELFASGKLVTVFSAKNYCGEYTNRGALLEIDRNLEILPKTV